MAVLPAARLQLQGSNDPAANQMLHARAAIVGQAQESCLCSGCGRRALGLRRCARCKQAACEWGAGVGGFSMTWDGQMSATLAHVYRKRLAFGQCWPGRK